MATVVIFGASRGVGLEVVKRALDAGHRVRAVARAAEEIPIDKRKLWKINASALNAGDVDRAVSGAHAVITCLGVPPTLKPVTLFSESTRCVIEAMAAHGVKRLIAVTGIGAGDSRGIGGALYTQVFQPIFLRTIYDDKDREEDIIRKTRLEWTIVRPGFLTRLPATGKYRTLTEPDQWEGGFIPRGDVADFLVKQIDDRAYLRQTPLLIA